MTGKADAGLSTARIWVMGDNEKLVQLAELNLRGEWKVLQAAAAGAEAGAKPDLIVLIASLPTSEPVVMLARTAWLRLVGEVALLIASDRPFPADERRRIFHLDFPFTSEKLREMVAAALAARPQPADQGAQRSFQAAPA